MKFGIDVSYYNGNIDWTRVKNAGVEFAILRLGYTGYGSARTKATDVKFEEYYRNAKAVGMPVGGYWFSCACSYNEGVQEANAVLNLVRGKQFEYPIYIDVEDPHHQVKVSKQAITDAIKGFCETMEKAGYYVGFYCNVDWYNNHMYADQLTKHDRWIASWTKTKPSIANKMWQFGGETNLIRSNKVDGIPDNVTDCNYCYQDYPSIIKNAGLNGFGKAQPTPQPTNDNYLGSRGYFKLGDEHPNIGKIADFMYRTFPAYTDKKALGNYYGKYIEASIREFQRRAKAEGRYNDAIDGCTGPKTLKALESYGFKR